MAANVGTPAREDQIELGDGRSLAFAEWGDLDGRPVFFFHGMPHSRRFSRAIASRTWPADVVTLADALGLGRFGVLGWSAVRRTRWPARR